MSPDYSPLRLDNQLCFPLYAASREIIRQYRPALDKLNLTYTQYITMMVLWEQTRISVKDLGARLYLDSGTLTPLLKNLEAKGYLRRERSKADERVLMVPQYGGSCVALTPEEAATLYHLLYKLLSQLEAK